MLPKTNLGKQFNSQLSDDEFDFIRKKIHSLAGISLGDNKKELVNGRLRKRILQLELESIQDYVDYIRNLPSNHTEWQLFINELTTNKTDFFREHEHFTYLIDEVIPKSEKKGLFRVWSAACSSGEEPYTIGAVLDRYAKNHPSFEFLIDASDIDTDMLLKAKNGVYPKAKLSEVPLEYQRDMFGYGTGGLSSWLRVKNEVRKNINFSSCNLLASPLPWTQSFNVIFCRNVFIYFTPETIEKICKNMYEKAQNGAYLFIGHSESLHNVKIPWVQVKPSVYRKNSK